MSSSSTAGLASAGRPAADSRPLSITLPHRVQYAECDPMGLAHHSVYPVWFEHARTELLRARGLAYAALEQAGLLIVVARLSISYRRPARYDELIDIIATLARVSAAKIEHEYQVRRDGELLCTAATTLACTDRAGRVIPVPQDLRMP